MKVFINPGHGGNDPGACGFGCNERDIVLGIGKLTQQYLDAVGFHTRLLQFDGLDEIVDAANFFDADIFISIHCNAFNGVAHGTESFYFYGSKAGARLAACINNQITDTIPLVNRGVKTAGFYVLANTFMPAALVETAFIDSPQDFDLLKFRQDDFARAIACGISDYFSL